MGLMNLRAVCPECGGRVLTEATALGRLTWMRSWVLVRTRGRRCEHCGAEFSRRVDSRGRAVLASEDAARAERKQAKQEARRERRDDKRDANRARLQAEIALRRRHRDELKATPRAEQGEMRKRHRTELAELRGHSDGTPGVA